jgi:hypothetical protein
MQNLLDHRLQNKEIESSIKESIESIFPIKSNGKVLQISNIVIEDALSDTDFAAQKEIKIKRKT